MKLRVTMPDGQYLIPCEHLAAQRAISIVAESEVYCSLEMSRARQKEYNLALANTEVLLDWVRAKMRWMDVAAYAVRIPVPADEMEAAWKCADGEIIEE